MEFSFFTVLLTAAGLVVFETGKYVFRLILLPFRSGVTEGREYRFVIAVAAGFIAMAVLGWFYLDQADIFWNTVTGRIELFFETVPLGSRMLEVLYVFRYFRDYYAALAGFLIMLVLWSAMDRRRAEGYRFVQRYRNWMLPILGFFWLAVLVLWKWQVSWLDQWAGKVLMNGAVYCTLIYAWKGYLLLACGFRKLKIGFWIACSAVYLLLVFSGAAFLFILLLFMGIGVSDTWMNYQRKRKRDGEFR